MQGGPFLERCGIYLKRQVKTRAGPAAGYTSDTIQAMEAKHALRFLEVNEVAEKWKNRLTNQLCASILSLETLDEAYRYLGDIATIDEIRILAQRLEIARLLGGGYTYPQIAQQTGASTATISRVKKYFEYGTDGYKLVIGRLKKEA